eukprot:CAMPEP_0181490798 /NCGR_PEP_ID=MMETSP1110-20121109/49760_1 /TAXON_ID=174948 /ORGANISM="Symbiodinium sp., Strain CCMP421" /LENGTH=115 /DNA_ID=CAMNT_0023617827 /DNA_START=43 /DNA_END=388 /DNA_ORIENTATION=+
MSDPSQRKSKYEARCSTPARGLAGTSSCRSNNSVPKQMQSVYGEAGMAEEDVGQRERGAVLIFARDENHKEAEKAAHASREQEQAKSSKLIAEILEVNAQTSEELQSEGEIARSQ